MQAGSVGLATSQDEEFEDFSSRVDEVEKTIKALMEGKIDPHEVDKKEEEIKRKQKEAEERKVKKKELQERQLRKMERDKERKKWGFIGRWCPRCRKDEAQIFEQVYGKDDCMWPENGPDYCISQECSALDVQVSLLTQEERREQLQARVADMKKERLAKAMARDRWNRWKSTQQFNRVGAEWEEKYDAWDKWLPSDDEEDELPPAPPPDDPQFKIMEKDMDDRAKDKARRRKEGEVCKNKGNAFMEQGKYRSAFAQYTKGLEQDKSSRALLTNRALCCLKLNNKTVQIVKLGEDIEVESFQQCIDDCTKCLDICEFLYDNVGPGIKGSRVKAHMRRAEAKKRLGMLADAVLDLQAGLDNIADLSMEDKRQLRDLIESFKGEKEVDERVKRLREIAGVADISVPDAAQAAADTDKPSALSKEGAAASAAESEADTEAAASTSPSSSASSPKSSCVRFEEEASKLRQAEADALVGGSAEAGAAVAPKVSNVRRAVQAAFYDKTDASPLATGQRVASWVDALREEEEEGIIAFDNEDGTYDIVLDDGTEKDAVPRAEIRHLQQSSMVRAVPEAEAGDLCAPDSIKAKLDMGVSEPDRNAARSEAAAASETKSGQAAKADSKVETCAAEPVQRKDDSPSLPKRAMRKIVVVEDDSDEEEGAQAGKGKAKSIAKDRADKPAPVRAAATPPALPGIASPGSDNDVKSAAEFAQRMAAMMQDPEIQNSLKNPRVQAVMAEMMAGANLKDSAANAPTDDEVLKRYKDDPEVMNFYSRITQSMEGVLKTPYPCDESTAAPTEDAAAANTGTSKKTEKARPPSGDSGKGAALKSKSKAMAGGGNAAAGLAGLGALDTEALGRLKGNADLQAALQNPKMLQKMHALMQNPTNVESAIAADPELAALEDKLMAALGTSLPSPSATAPSGPSGGPSSAKTKVMSGEEKLKASLAVVQRLKMASEKHASMLGAIQAEDDQEDQDRMRRDSLSVLCKEVFGDLETLQEFLDDDDVIALMQDQGGVDAVCSILMAMPQASSAAPAERGKAQQVLVAALIVLRLVAVNERCMMAVLLHHKGRSLVKMLAWMQGVERSEGSTVADVAHLLEVALQHENVRRTMLKKTWTYSPKGAEVPARISLLAAAAAAMAQPLAMQPAIGCITNAAFEEHGKEQLLAHEQSIGAGDSSAGADPSLNGSIIEAAVRVADTNPAGTDFGGSGPGILRAKALRLLLNVSAFPPLRALVGKGSGLKFIVRIVEEQAAASLKAKYSKAAASSVAHGQDALDTTLGLLMNLGLDDEKASELLSASVLAPLASVLRACPWDSCVARCASASARVLRLSEGAKQARVTGVLQGLIQVVKNAAGNPTTAAPVAFPPPAGSGLSVQDAKAEVMDPCVRALAQALRNDDGSSAIVGEDPEALLAIMTAVRCGREGTVGNAALALQMVANRPDCLERLGKAGAVPSLLNVVHHMRGPAQRNAALALARVVKREENLALLKALHGLDILNCYLKL